MAFYTVHCKKCQQEWQVMCSFEKLAELTCGHEDYWGRKMLFNPDTDETQVEGCGNPVETVRNCFRNRRQQYGYTRCDKCQWLLVTFFWSILQKQEYNARLGRTKRIQIS